MDYNVGKVRPVPGIRLVVFITVIMLTGVVSSCGGGQTHDTSRNIQSISSAAQNGERNYRRATRLVEQFGGIVSGGKAIVVARVARRYFVLLFEGKFRDACSLLTGRARSHAGIGSCPNALKRFFSRRQVRGSVGPLHSAVIKQVRIQGAQGFVFLSARRVAPPEAFVAMEKESDRWRVASIMPAAFRVKVEL